jgi:hypothetical protein
VEREEDRREADSGGGRWLSDDAVGGVSQVARAHARRASGCRIERGRFGRASWRRAWTSGAELSARGGSGAVWVVGRRETG